MTTELTKLREALRRVKYEAVSLDDAQVIALEALTTSQPAQAGEVDASKLLNGLSHDALVSELIKASGRRDVLHASHMGKGMSDADYTEFSRLRDQYIPALRRQILARITTQPAAQATPEPCVTRLSAVEAISHAYLNGGPGGLTQANALLRSAATPTQQAAGEPVAWMHTSGIVHARHSGWPSQTVEAYTPAKGWTPLYTHPAPGVPEGEVVRPKVEIDLGEGDPRTARIVWSDWDSKANKLVLCLSVRDPEGFALVPVEPTPEMLKAANEALHKEAAESGLGNDTRLDATKAAGSYYRAMLAAAQAKGGEQ